LDQFAESLREAPPIGAQIEHWEQRSIAPRDDKAFCIAPSPLAGDAPASAGIPPDLAPCDDCLRELVDPANRRYRYPFINCCASGPRCTISREVPYDRPKTTMARFPMCPECTREYVDPMDRRFHAEPNACAVCGPHARLVTPHGRLVLEGDGAIRAAAN